jgi:ATP-dependent protease ClpP protease subunit
MELEKLERVKSALNCASPLISEIEKMRNAKLIVFFCIKPINSGVAFKLHQVLRMLKGAENLDILIESGGGDIDAASKIFKMLKSNCKKLAAIVPFYCKSAATLIAVSADELIMCKSGELGPVDTIVKDPVTDIWIPAHSIKEAISFIEETTDPLVKLSMADKLSPLLLGAFRDAQNAAKQYLEEALNKLGNRKEQALETFTTKFLSHGYPIDRDLCKSIGLNVIFPSDELEDKICSLHAIYVDLMMNLKTDEIMIIQTSDKKCVEINGEDISASV